MDVQKVTFLNEGPVSVITFYGPNREVVGDLFLNKNGKMEFEGVVEDSVRVLFDHVCKLVNSKAKEEG